MLYSGDMSTFWREVAAAEVTAFAAPPRMYSLMHSLYEQRALVAGHDVAIAECTSVLGESCSSVSVGGASTVPDLLIWMRRLWGHKLTDGYGCTECGSIAHNGILDQHVRVIIDSESDSLPTCKMSDDDSVIGILWVHTRNCATAYAGSDSSGSFKRINEVSFTGEPYSVYYNTGDRVVYWPSRRQLQVIGRAKNTLRLSNATFVDADAIQSAIALSKTGYYDTGNVLISCRSSSSIVVAIVQIRDSVSLSAHSKQGILEEIRASCKSKNIPAAWIPHHVVVDSKLWTAANGCLTASGKLRRLGIEAHVSDELEDLFQGPCDPKSTRVTENLLVNSVLTSDVFIALVEQCVRSGLQVDHSLSLIQNGCDSIAIAQLASNLQKFKTRVPVSTSVLHSRSITDLISCYCGENYVSPSEPSTAEVLLALAESDSDLPLDLLSPIVQSSLNLPKNGVFVTGATGFLGIHILHNILQQSDSFHVFCLVRGSSEHDATLRLQNQAENALLELCWDRISVIVGDLALPLFGLTTVEFGSVASKIDFIIHNGALVHWLKDYHSMRMSNVVGTHTCAQLAHMAAVKSFVYVSSSSAIVPGETESSGKPGTSLLPLPPVANMSGYGASKRVSEVFLCRFALQHPSMALCILRPATIISSPHHPSYNMHDAFARYIHSCFLLKLAPIDDSVVLHFVTVDLVSKVAAESLIDRSGGRPTLLNILCGSGLSLSRVSQCIRSVCSEVECVSLQNWLQTLKSNCPPPLQPLYHIFQRHAFPWSRAGNVCRASDVTVISQMLSEDAAENSARWVAANMASVALVKM